MRLSSGAAAGVFSLLYMGLPAMLLSAAVFLVHFSADPPPWATRAMPGVLQQLLSGFVLTTIVPDPSFAGRCVVVVSGMGVAIIMTSTAAYIAATASRLVATVPPGRWWTLGQWEKVDRIMSKRWFLAAVLLAIGVHVFLSIQVAFARLFVAHVCFIASRRQAAHALRMPAILGAAGDTKVEPASIEHVDEAGTVSQSGLTLRVRSSLNRSRPTEGVAATPTEGVLLEDQRLGCAYTERQGPAVVAAVALAAGLALPSFIACSQAVWMAPAMEDILPGAMITCGALLAAAQCDRLGGAQVSKSKLTPRVDPSCYHCGACMKVFVLICMSQSHGGSAISLTSAIQVEQINGSCLQM